ncbi:MAG TPA: hypothetical protein VFD58_19975 [Blastocatellia bacterium]|nr:hypothetical protein [Blastocatellia bacterium]
MWKWLLLYVPLAVLTNTAFPLSFEPVLIWFASRCHPQQVGALVVVGALCAGVGGLIDLKLSAVLRPKVADNRWVDLLPEWGGGKFYLLAFLFALLPLPFSLVRLAMLRQQPELAPYLLAVAAGRLPRYLLTVHFWRSLALPNWVNLILLLAAVVFAACKYYRRPAKAELS